MTHPSRMMIDPEDWMAAISLDKMRNSGKKVDQIREAEGKDCTNLNVQNSYWNPTSLCWPWYPEYCQWYNHSVYSQFYTHNNSFYFPPFIHNQNNLITSLHGPHTLDHLSVDSSSTNLNSNEKKVVLTEKKTKTRPFACFFPMCNKTYLKKSHLITHTRIHTGERPYVCNWINCVRSFTRSDELCRHIRCHSGDKRYKCENCEMCFVRKDHLVKHVNRRHQKITI